LIKKKQKIKTDEKIAKKFRGEAKIKKLAIAQTVLIFSRFNTPFFLTHFF